MAYWVGSAKKLHPFGPASHKLRPFGSLLTKMPPLGWGFYAETRWLGLLIAQKQGGKRAKARLARPSYFCWMIRPLGGFWIYSASKQLRCKYVEIAGAER